MARTEGGAEPLHLAATKGWGCRKGALVGATPPGEYWFIMKPPGPDMDGQTSPRLGIVQESTSRFGVERMQEVMVGLELWWNSTK